MFMVLSSWQSWCESLPIHTFDLMKADSPPGGRLPSDQAQPSWAVRQPVNGCYRPHPLSPFITIIITEPKS